MHLTFADVSENSFNNRKEKKIDDFTQKMFERVSNFIIRCLMTNPRPSSSHYPWWHPTISEPRTHKRNLLPSFRKNILSASKYRKNFISAFFLSTCMVSRVRLKKRESAYQLHLSLELQQHLNQHLPLKRIFYNIKISWLKGTSLLLLSSSSHIRWEGEDLHWRQWKSRRRHRLI